LNSQTARLNSDGSFDNTYTSITTGAGMIIYSTNVLSDDKIILGGSFTSIGGFSLNRIVRLNSDGNVDTSFVIGTGFNDIVFITEEQSDGKILVGGRFTSYSGTSQNRITRLNSNGTRDTSFSISTGFAGGIGTTDVLAIEIQSDGKILVGGNFATYQGQSYNNIIRLNSDGSIDSSFVVGTGFDAAVLSIKVQSDGKIIVVGDFTSYNGISVNKIIRLNSNGTQNICS
jgi:uncharacterized delta-60 repeat protein